MEETFGSTCHGAGRVLSRSAAMRELSSAEVLRDLTGKGNNLFFNAHKIPCSLCDICHAQC